MAIREILQLGNPKLHEKSIKIDKLTALEIKMAAQDLQDTLEAFRVEYKFGRAIAAPQIGLLKRMIFLGQVGELAEQIIINPVVVKKSDNNLELWDNCLSFSDLMVKVSRAAEITVEYVDLSGERKTLEAEGDLSELLQHEIDHLDGILAVEKAITPRSFCTRKEWLCRAGSST